MLEILLGNAVAAAGLAVVVVLVCRFFKPSPAARHALWLIVMVKLLSPVGFVVSLPLPFEQPRFLVADRPPAPAPREAPVTVFTVQMTEQDSIDEEPISLPEQPIADVQASSAEPAGASLYFWLLTIWLAGAIAVALRYAQRTLRFARYARTGRLTSGSLQRQVAQLAHRLGVRAPAVRVLADLPSPVIWCLFRRALLWPKGLQELLSGEGRRAVLIHELAHLRRGDHWFRWLELAAAVVYWWNPLFWLVRRQLRFHAELACDAWVTELMPDARRSYAEALLEVCARSNRAAAPSPAVGVGGDGHRDFQRRLTMIMREQVPCRLAAWTKMFVVLMAMAAIPAWTLGQGKPEPKSAEKKSPALDDKQIQELLKGLKLEFELKDLRQAEAKLVPMWTELKVDSTAKQSEIDAKIAELKRQIELLTASKAAKEAAEKLKKTEPLSFWLDAGPHKERIIVIDGMTGKVLWSQGSEPKPAPKVELQPPPHQPPVLTPWQGGIRVELKSKQQPYKFIGPDGKERTVPPTTPNPNAPQFKVIGPDGKEIKDAKVIVVDPSAPANPNTYRPMPAHEQIEAARAAQERLEAARAQLEAHREDLEAHRKALEMQLKTIRPPQQALPPPQAPPVMVQIRPVPGALKPAAPQVPLTVSRWDATATNKAISLTRATYVLSKEKAETLAAFLKANVKASVLELKVEGEGLIVTTTPEVQATIGNLINLMKGPEAAYFKLRILEEKK